MTIFLADPDVTLHLGDVLEVLAGMPSGSVDCVITSPPYWGLRDYGTGLWEGGNPDCDHRASSESRTANAKASSGLEGSTDTLHMSIQFRDVCGKCGATRQDRQLGLEPTPDHYVTRMVEVFREIRRVLAPHGTCWVNLGDSYNGVGAQYGGTSSMQKPGPMMGKGTGRTVAGLKPKDLVGIPWRVAFALQADGWYLRADIVWSKPNPMPESVTDRPTKAHEYVFLLTKQSRYWFDQEAVRETRHVADIEHAKRYGSVSYADKWNGTHPNRSDSLRATTATGRNVRSVWEIATQPYPEAHFATYPEELVRRCLLAGCPEWVCRVCGRPRERIVERPKSPWDDTRTHGVHTPTSVTKPDGQKVQAWLNANPPQTVGWSDCGHNNHRPGLVLDPFIGSGTTAHVARKHGRRCIGIDLNKSYLELAARRLQQLSLFAEAQ